MMPEMAQKSLSASRGVLWRLGSAGAKANLSRDGWCD